MTDATTPPDTSATDLRQLLAAIILGLAAVLTAVAAYSASVSGGDAANLRTDAGRTLADANFFYSQANQVAAGDQALFVAFATATQEDNTDLGAYLTTLMRPELSDAIDWWIKTDEAVTPFDEIDSNPYFLEDLVEANRLEAEAEDQVSRSQDKDDLSSKYDLSTVLLALTLFFAGVATLFRRRLISWLMLFIGTLTLAAGGGYLALNLF